MKRNRYEYKKLAYEVYWFEKICNKCKSIKLICIHHIDEDFTNNKRDNLEVLCNSCHLSHHKKWKKLNKQHIINASKGRSKKLSQYKLDWEFIQNFDNQQIASLSTKINQSSISLVCNWKQKTAGGYIWNFIK